MSLHADTINSFRTKYKLNSDHDICFVIRTAKTYWLPQGGKSLKALLLERAKMDSNDSELYLAYSDEMIFKIDQSLNLNSKTTPKGLPNYLF